MPCSIPMGVRAGHQTTAAKSQVGTSAQCWEPNKCETATKDGLLLS